MKHLKKFEKFSEKKEVVNTIEDFAAIIHQMGDVRSMIHSDAEQAETLGNMSSKDAYQDACDGFCDKYLDNVVFNISNGEISNWLWDYAS
jgi:hypothetical protein